eukprot:4182684-Pleurochrysis_carterae.AAC.5
MDVNANAEGGQLTAPPTSKGVEQMGKEVAKECVPLGSDTFRLAASDTAGCSFSLGSTGSNFEKAGAPIDRAILERRTKHEVTQLAHKSPQAKML